MPSDQMMSVSIRPDPIALGKAFANLDVHGFLRAEVNSLAFSVERYAKQLTPVSSGHLRRSINTSPSTYFELVAIVSTNTNYAIYVHDGTKYMRGRPFMKYGAMFAQAAELKDINIKLDKKFTNAFKYSGFKQY